MQAIRWRRVLSLALALIALLVLSGAVGAFVASAPNEVITAGVTVHGIDIGGLTRQSAAVYLSGYLKELSLQPIEVVYGAESWNCIPRDFGVEVDIDSVLREAVSVAKHGSLLERWRMRRKAQRYGIEIPVRLRSDESTLRSRLGRIAAAIDTPARNAEFIVLGETVEIVPSQSGIQVDLEALRADFLVAIRSVSERQVHVKARPVVPARSTTDAINMGVREKIASFTTEFDPTDTSRNHNIRLAVEALRGTIVNSGATFSFNSVTGPRLASAGYKPAPVIIDGELLPGIGGGVCQVSTTLYNAALLAALSITARVPHSLPVRYVPLGQDAAVAYDYLDLQFVNPLPTAVLIDGEATDHDVTISLYSTPIQSDRVRLESKILSILEPDTETKPDETLLVGVKKEVKKGRRGFRVAVYRVSVGPKGEESARELVSETVYYPRNRIVHIGDGRKREDTRE